MEANSRKGRSFLEVRPWHCKGCPRPSDSESKYLLIWGKFGKVEGWGCPSHQCAFVNVTWFNPFYPLYEIIENTIGYTLAESFQGKREITEDGIRLIKALLDLDRKVLSTIEKK